MLELRDYGYNYQVIFKGEKENYSDFFVFINKFQNALKFADKPG